MNWEALGAIAELVAAIGVIASLLYLALQIRQNTDTTRASNELEEARLWSDLHAGVWSSPDFARIFDAGNRDWEGLTEDDRRRYMWFIAHYFVMLDGLFQQFRRGLLSSESWRPHETMASGLLRYPGVLLWWRSDLTPLSEPFVAHLQKLIDSPPESVWKYTPPGEL